MSNICEAKKVVRLSLKKKKDECLCLEVENRLLVLEHKPKWF